MRDAQVIAAALLGHIVIQLLETVFKDALVTADVLLQHLFVLFQTLVFNVLLILNAVAQLLSANLILVQAVSVIPNVELGNIVQVEHV